MNIATLELDEFDSEEAMDAICHVYQGLQQKRSIGAEEINPDSEFVWSRGALLIPRFHWITVADELANKSSEEPSFSRRLEIGKRGSLKTLEWVSKPKVLVGLGKVSVEVRAVGMNFKVCLPFKYFHGCFKVLICSKDILIAMGIVDGTAEDESGLGCECSGVVTQVHPDVTDLQVGDRVGILATGSYSTILNAKADLCVKIPDQLSFEEAATMPTVYTTVVYGLLELARLQRGQV